MKDVTDGWVVKCMLAVYRSMELWGANYHQINVVVGLVIFSAHYAILFVFSSKRLLVQAVASSSGLLVQVSPGNTTLHVLLSLHVVPLRTLPHQAG